jgi:hypothetical protein
MFIVKRSPHEQERKLNPNISLAWEITKEYSNCKLPLPVASKWIQYEDAAAVYHLLQDSTPKQLFLNIAFSVSK